MKHWDKMKKEKRSKYNAKYLKTKEEFDALPEDVKKGFDIPKEYKDKDPKDITLDRAVKYMYKAYGSVDIIFKDDVNEEEINAITAIVKQEMGL